MYPLRQNKEKDVIYTCINTICTPFIKNNSFFLLNCTDAYFGVELDRAIYTPVYFRRRPYGFIARPEWFCANKVAYARVATYPSGGAT